MSFQPDAKPNGTLNLPNEEFKLRPMRIFLVVLGVLVLGSSPAWAVLGEYANSVNSDQQRMHAQLHEIVRQGYLVKQLSAANGRAIREYVSPAGVVFGVAWQGPTMPDLRQLLGS